MNTANEDAESDPTSNNIITDHQTIQISTSECVNSSTSTPLCVEVNGIYYMISLDQHFEDKSGESGGEQESITFINPEDPQVQVPIYLDQVNLAESQVFEEIPQAEQSDHPGVSLEEQQQVVYGHPAEVKVEESDYEALTAIKLGASIPIPAASESVEQLNDVDPNISLKDISIKLPKLPESPEALISAEIITHGLGNLSRLGLSSRIAKLDTDLASAQEAVATYFALNTSDGLLALEDLPNISWSNFILPRNVLLVRHPLVRIRGVEGFTDQHCIFPSNAEGIHGISVGVISHTSSGIVVKNRDGGPIHQYFNESISSSNEDMYQNPDGVAGSGGSSRNEQVHIQLYQVQRPGTMSSEGSSNHLRVVPYSPVEYVQDHTKWLYAIHPKGGQGSHVIVVQPASADIPNIGIGQSQSPLQQSHSVSLVPATSPVSVSSSNNNHHFQVHPGGQQLNSNSLSPVKPKAKPKKPPRKTALTPKPPRPTPLKRSRKAKSESATTAIAPVPDPVYTNNVSSSVNGFSGNNQVIGGNDGTTMVLSLAPDGTISQHLQCLTSTSSSPIMSNTTLTNEFQPQQQYLIMSPSNFSQVQSGHQQLHTLNHEMVTGSIQNSARIQVNQVGSNMLNQSYQQQNPIQQTSFTTSSSQASSPANNANSNQLIGTGGLGTNISKLGNGNMRAQFPSTSTMIRAPSPGPSMSPVSSRNKHPSVVRQPMFAPIQVGKPTINKGHTATIGSGGASGGIPVPKVYSPTPAPVPIQQVNVHVNNTQQYSTSTPKIKVIVEETGVPLVVPPPTFSYRAPPTTHGHTRKTNPAHPSPRYYRPSQIIESVTVIPQPRLTSPAKDKYIEAKSIIPEEPAPEAFTRDRFIAGHEALCAHCGTRTRDLHHCEYCKTRIPNEAKLVPSDPNCKNNNVESKNHNPHLTPVQQMSCEPAKKQVVKKPAVRKSKGGGKRQEELIVLSSSEDEDEDQPKAKVPKSDNNATNNKIDSVQSSGSNSPAFGGGGVGKEFKINLSPASTSLAASTTPTNSQRRTYLLHEDEMDFEKLIEEIQESMLDPKKQIVKADCRSIRVGDYKCSAPNPLGGESFTVVFSERGILFTLPHAQTSHKAVVCALPIDNILMVEANYKKNLPVVFLATGPRLAKSLRKLLGMSDDPKDQGYHYGPQDGDKYQKRIVFLLTSITDQASATINKIFGRTLSEIDNVKANSILCDITRDPPVVTTNSPGNKKLVIGTSKLPNNALSSPQKQATTNSADHPLPSQVDVSKNKKLLSYHAIDILQQDVLCLADEQFLNDSILDFWLRYIEHEILPPEAKDRTYMFSTFFYKRLTTRPKKRNSAIEDDPKITASEKRHNRVKRWTKNVDIFDKDFLIIPINESLHWFLAVICFPGLQGVHDMITGEPIPDYHKTKKKILTKAKNTTTKTDPISNGFVNDNEDGTPEPSASANSSNESSQTQSQECQDGEINQSNAVNIKQPCILVFDSLVGDTRGRVYSTLREYLRMEYKTRKGEDREFTKTSMPGVMPRVPQQPNHCDCGIYTLFYVECFFKWPMKTFDILTANAMTSEEYYAIWCRQSSCSTKREDIYKSTKELVKQTNPDALPFFPQLTFTPTPPAPIRMSQLKQIESAPVEKLEKIAPGEEPMDVEVDSNLPSDEPAQSSISEPTLSTVESAIIRSSPADHDHDYAGLPTPTPTTPLPE